MKTILQSHAYNDCIALWRKGEVERAREALCSIPSAVDGTANQALRRKLEWLLNSGAADGLQTLDDEAAPASDPRAVFLPARGDAWMPTTRAAPALRPVTPVTPRRADSAFAPSSVLAADEHEPQPGVTLVAACMNRQHNLFKVLPSWLATEADEIIIVDWSSSEPLWPTLRGIDDPRLKVVRIEGESRWILTHALNIGLRMASRSLIFKLDCDIEVAPDFIATNRVSGGEFVRGFWKLAVDAGEPEQKYTNGTFGAFKKDLRAIGYYDERIVTYGWDDSDLYGRLAHDLGLAGKLIEPQTLRHIEQEERQRLENQDVAKQPFLGRFEPTELEGTKNKYLTSLSMAWGSYHRAQDYALAYEGGLLCGRRSSIPLAAQPEIQSLATTLAVRQLSLSIARTLPNLPFEMIGGLGLSRLISDAHRQGTGNRLVSSLRTAQGMHFVRCPDPALRAAVDKTLALLASHDEAVRGRIVIAEGIAPLEADLPAAVTGQMHFVASGELIDTLARTLAAAPLADAGLLEQTLRDGAATCTCTTISFESLTDEVLRKASSFTANLGSRFATAAAPVSGSAMVTSLYDEHNLIRLVEYLTCVVLNLQVFERLIVCYESRDGVLHAILRRIATRLALPVGRLIVIPYDARPTFAELFNVQHLLPKGTLLAAANADIAFDASLAKLREVDMSSTITVLSRWDVVDGGRDAALIRIDNGTPNTFSADAWIAATPFEPDFFLDYPIGTMHCDSFINNQIGKSARYRVINPCFDVRVFHLHDERFNSSMQKRVRDLAEIQEKYGIERARNGNNDPIRGVGWSTLAGAPKLDPACNLQQWKNRALVIDMVEAGTQLGGLLVLHLVRGHLAATEDLSIVVRLREGEARGAAGDLFARYQAFFKADNVLLDVDDCPINAAVAQVQDAFIKRVAAEDLPSRLCDPDHTVFTRGLDELIQWPLVEGTKTLRAELKINLNPETQFQVIQAIAARHPWVLDALDKFLESLDAWSAERRLLTPFISDLTSARARPRTPPAILRSAPRVSFVTSLFRGGDYLPGYLENVVLAAREAGGEVIIVDANGDDSDVSAIRSFMQEHPAAARLIDYVKLDRDPGLYNCWRIAIERSRAPLITNANLDDRRSPWHTARLVKVLEQHAEFAGACGSISCVATDGENQWFSLTENQVWFHGEGSRAIGLQDLYVRDEAGDVRSRNVMHCMPVWRKTLHQKFGFFNEEHYGTSADWAFWLQCAQAGEMFWFEQEAFGRYFLNPTSHNRRNDSAGIKELRIIEDFIGSRQNRITKQ